MNNETYTIIKELQLKNAQKDEKINRLSGKIDAMFEEIRIEDENYELVVTALNKEIGKHILAKQKAVDLLYNVKFKTNKRFQAEVEHAIEVLL